MNNPSLESYYFVFKYCAFDQFSRDFRKNTSCGIIQPHLMFLVYLLATNWLSVCRSLKKLNEGPTMFMGSAVQKLQEKRSAEV